MPIDFATRDAVREWLQTAKTSAAQYRAQVAVEQVLIPHWPTIEVARDLPPIEAKMALYDVVHRTLGDDEPLSYLEFGVYRGWSIFQMSARFVNPASRFVGFDSFEGLPERWKDMDPGTFTRRGEPPNTDDHRISFRKGWFQNTLPDFLKGCDVGSSNVLVHFDADLYSSTLFCLASLWHHIPRYYFVFDEFMSDEILAFADFMSAFPIKYELIAQTNGGGYPTQIFGRLERTDLTV